MSSPEIRKILVRGTNWLGDAVMTIPALQRLRASFPHAHITLLAPPRAAEVFTGFAELDEIIVYLRKEEGTRAFLASMQQLRRERFDLALLFQNAFEAALLAFLSGAKIRIGYDTQGRGALLTHKLTRGEQHRNRHQTNDYLDLVAEAERVYLGNSSAVVRNTIPALTASAEQRQAAAKFLPQTGKLIALNVGATNSRAKCWPEDRFAALADRMVAQLNARIVLIGAGSERENAARVIAQMQQPNAAQNLAGETSIAELIGLLASCDLLVTNDTGPAHVGAALSIPTLTIFGPTNEFETAPLGLHSELIRADGIECARCMHRECPIDHRCMTRITVEDVVRKSLFTTGENMIRIFIACAFLVTSIAIAATPSIVTIRTPHQGRVPEVALDKQGVLHLVYGKEQDGYYVQSRDSGKTFSAPVKVDQRAGTITVGAERGVKIAIGKDGVIHAVWLGHYQKGGGIWYTRSTDGGKTFAPERNVQDTNVGSDSPAIVADASGNVLVFWLDARLPKDAENPVTEAIILACSTDNGATFARNEIVKYDFAGRACACCRLEARLSGDDVYIAFRSGHHNLRDFYLLKGRKTENNFKAVRVSVDDWKLEGCPMSGADFRVEKDGQVVVSWMSQGKVYWSKAKTMATGFAPRTQAPDGEGAANHPLILTNRKRDVLLWWKQKGNLHWARYTRDGKFTGEQGVVAAMPSKDKATAFVGADEKFYVVVAE